MEKGELIGKGRTAEVYAWGTDRILKLYESRMADHLVEQEYNVTRAAKSAGLSVPATDQLIEIDGKHGIIFERLEGPSMLKSIASQPWKTFAFARQLAELHAQIHNCTVPPNLPLQRKQIENGIQVASDFPTAMKEKSLAYLAQLPDGNSFCHGDFHPDNIIMTSHGPIIIDWMTGTSGNPLADICRTFLLFETTGLPPGYPLHLRVMGNILRFLIENTYRKRYLQIRPTARQQIDAWLLPIMVARLREVEEYPRENQLLLTRINKILQSQISNGVK
jgi:uncharacterized protein (TIGR02172 family)